jgi:hypothetical protein
MPKPLCCPGAVRPRPVASLWGESGALLSPPQRHDPAQDHERQNRADADDEIEFGHKGFSLTSACRMLNILLRTVARFLRAIPLPRAICENRNIAPELLTSARDGRILTYLLCQHPSDRVCRAVDRWPFAFLGVCMITRVRRLYWSTIGSNILGLGLCYTGGVPLPTLVLCHAITAISGVLLWRVIVHNLQCAFWRDVETTVSASAAPRQAVFSSALASDSPETIVVLQ